MGDLSGNDPYMDNYLAHYGVVGMKWGKRSGGLKSRAKGAARDSIERRLTSNKEIAEGRGESRDYYRRATLRAPGAILAGSTKSAARRSKKLQGALDRLDAGKMTKRDKLGAAMNTPLIDLAVSRRDKRALPGSPQAKQNTGKQKAAKIIIGVGAAVLVTNLGSRAGNQIAVRR